MEDLGDHSPSHFDRSFCSSNTLMEYSRSTTLKHLRFL
jgi:hypothetical protein